MKKLFTFFALSCVLNALEAQNGKLDSTFGINGLSVVKNVGSNGDSPVALLITSNGKNVQVANAFTDSSTHFLLVCRNDNGTLDRRFGNGGFSLADVNGRDGNAFSAVELPGGKFMIAGNVLEHDYSKYTMVLMRFFNNGLVDSTFGTNGYMKYSIGDDYGSDYPTGLLLQSDGKLVATGYTSISGHYVFFAAGFMPDGARDITFGNKSKTFVSFGGGTLFANGAALQDDGKIIVIGSAQTGGYEFDYAMTRINPDGSLDKTFGESGKVTTDFGGNNDFAYGVSFQHNKKIILAGYYNAGNKADLGVVRYNIDGSVDSTFGKKGKSFAALDNSNVDCFSATVQPDDKIVAGCTAYYLSGTRSDYALFRFTPDGKPDVDFGTNGQVITSITNGFDGINQVRINAKGEILVSGSSQNSAGISRLSEARYLTTYQTAPNTVSAINIAAVDKSEKSITVYPNPAKDYVNLKTAWTANEWVNVGIYNVEGKILLNKKYFVASEDDIIKIVLEPTWKAGSYYIKVEGSKTFRTSFVITR